MSDLMIILFGSVSLMGIAMLMAIAALRHYNAEARDIDRRWDELVRWTNDCEKRSREMNR